MSASCAYQSGEDSYQIFDEDTEPHDEHLSELIHAASSKEILCQAALIPLSKIRPFSDYKPKHNEAYERYFQMKLSERDLPFLLVYAVDDYFVMSDDYNAYYQYLKCGASSAFCTVIGMVPMAEGKVPRTEGVVLIGDPFYAEDPAVEVIDSK